MSTGSKRKLGKVLFIVSVELVSINFGLLLYLSDTGTVVDNFARPQVPTCARCSQDLKSGLLLN